MVLASQGDRSRTDGGGRHLDQEPQPCPTTCGEPHPSPSPWKGEGLWLLIQELLQSAEGGVPGGGAVGRCGEVVFAMIG